MGMRPPGAKWASPRSERSCFVGSGFIRSGGYAAHKIAGPRADAKIQELARRVAETEIDLDRARYARHRLLNRALRDPDYGSEARVREKDALSKPTGPLKLALILSDKARQLLAIDRYERRAFSRRKFVIRLYYESCK